MPARFDGQWLRSQWPHVATSMDRFIDKVRQEARGDVVGDLEIVRIPLVLYRARNATSWKWRNGAPSATSSPIRRCFCSAIRRSGRRTSSRSRSASSARCTWRGSWPGGTCRSATCSTATSCHLQAVAARLHAQQDDQAQQGSVRDGRRQARAARQAAHLLALTLVDGAGQGADFGSEMAAGPARGACTIHAQRMHNAYAKPARVSAAWRLDDAGNGLVETGRTGRRARKSNRG